MKSIIQENKEWKDIKGYEGLYKISEYGDILSLKIRHNKVNKDRSIPLLLKPQIRNNYFIINLCKNGKRKQYSIHRLVAENFIDNPKELNIVNHKDFNTFNNHYSNLEWCTQKENVRYSICNMVGKEHKRKDKEYCIYYRKRINAYEVTIKNKYYGYFKTLEEARKKREEILNEIYFSKRERVLVL